MWLLAQNNMSKPSPTPHFQFDVTTRYVDTLPNPQIPSYLTFDVRSILTVGDMDGFARQCGMIRCVTEKNKVRFGINVEAAKATKLTIRSKLLRPAEIVCPGKD